jgi:hypothetical protein
VAHQMTHDFKHAKHRTEGMKTGVELHFNQISQSNQTMHLGKTAARLQVNFVISRVSIGKIEKHILLSLGFLLKENLRVIRLPVS